MIVIELQKYAGVCTINGREQSADYQYLRCYEKAAIPYITNHTYLSGWHIRYAVVLRTGAGIEISH